MTIEVSTQGVGIAITHKGADVSTQTSDLALTHKGAGVSTQTAAIAILRGTRATVSTQSAYLVLINQNDKKKRRTVIISG